MRYTQTARIPAQKSAGSAAADRSTAAHKHAPPADALGAALNESPRSRSLMQLRAALDKSPRVRAQLALQHTLNDPAPVQKKPNATGLPDRLKAGVENLSGLALDDVRVHYNSAKPAAVQAHAYTQGTEIHVAPGQEQHLPHEAWHVVQQKQGRVKPTLQMNGVAINDDAGLERDADAMGGRAEGLIDLPDTHRADGSLQTKFDSVQRKRNAAVSSDWLTAGSGGGQNNAVQRVVKFKQMTGEVTEPDLDQIFNWLSRGGYQRSPELEQNVGALMAHRSEFTVDWAYGQRTLIHHLNQVVGPMRVVEQAGAQAGSARLIAGAYWAWLNKWAPRGADDEESQATLRNDWSEAADHLEALLRHAGVDPRPGDREAREKNSRAFPNVGPTHLVDMLTVLADLRTFGPRPDFRPVQTIETVFKWARALSRL